MKYSMDGLLGIICMFLNGFVTLCPYYIATTCCSYAINRFHLPPYAASLFVYKFHYPMDLSNLISAFLAFALTVFIDVSFDSKSIHNMSFKRKVSCISMWVTLISSVISYIAFISCEDCRRFRYVYLSIILLTLSNGFSSCFAFAVNTNSIIYAAGISVSSLVSFFLHKTYKHFYNLYHWGEYDYNLVILHYSFAMLFLAVARTLWILDQYNEIENDSKGYVSRGTFCPCIGTDVIIDLSQTDTNLGNGYYGSVKITVAKGSTGVPSDYDRFDHKRDGHKPFNLGSVIHKDVQLNGIHFTENVTAVYVYYKCSKDDEKREFPLIVCVKGSSTKYYKRGNQWTDITSVLKYKDPDDESVCSDIKTRLDEVKVKYEVKLENGSQYTARPGTGTEHKINIQGLSTNSGFKGYRHHFDGDVSQKVINLITVNNQVISNIKDLNGGFTHQASGGVFVYYETDIKKPLLICLSKNGQKSSNPGDNIWYKRTGTYPNYTWLKEDSNYYKDIEPQTNPVALKGKLDKIKVALTNNDTGYPKPSINVRLDYVPKNESNTSISYVTNNKQITVARVTTKVPSGYVAYEHSHADQLNDVKFKHLGLGLKGLPNGVNITSNKTLWVYYEKDSQGSPIINRPLLICVNSGSHTWYRRGDPWEKTNKVNGDPNGSVTGLAEVLPKYIRQGSLKELIYFDNLYHWSPILMLTFPLGIICMAYPISTPYSLIDPERAKEIDLCIAIISTIPNLGLAILDLDLIEIDFMGPSGKWNNNRWFYNCVWVLAMPYIICLCALTSTIRSPDGFIGRGVKNNPFLVGLFSVTLNTSQKLMESTAFGGVALQSYEGYIGTIIQFSIILMLSLRLLITLFCDGYFDSVLNVGGYAQPLYTYHIHSPWTPLLITPPLHIQQPFESESFFYPEAS